MASRGEPEEGGGQGQADPAAGLPALAVSAAGWMFPGQEGFELDQCCPKFSDEKNCPGY